MNQLIECRTCGKEVSMNAVTCPHCGEPYPTRSIVCPKCGSEEIAVQGRKGFNTGKALVGAILVGPLGVAAGGLGHQNILLTCSNCGYNWQATPQQLQAQLMGKPLMGKPPLLEVGMTMTGVVLSGNKSSSFFSSPIVVDLGSGRLGSLSPRGGVYTPGDSIEVSITMLLPSNRGNGFRYMLELVDRGQFLLK